MKYSPSCSTTTSARSLTPSVVVAASLSVCLPRTGAYRTAHDRKIGVAFYPIKDVLVAVAQAKTMWEGEELHVNETPKT